MTRRVEFVPPGRSRILVGRLIGRVYVGLFWCGHCFDVGLEVWRAGGAINVGPLSLAAALVRDVKGGDHGND